MNVYIDRDKEHPNQLQITVFGKGKSEIILKVGIDELSIQMPTFNDYGLAENVTFEKLVGIYKFYESAKITSEIMDKIKDKS